MLTFDFKSQTLTGLIFKCDLNFGKMNADSCSGGWNQSRRTKWKKVKILTFD